jgi:hypothetical protein
VATEPPNAVQQIAWLLLQRMTRTHPSPKLATWVGFSQIKIGGFGGESTLLFTQMID